MKTILQFIKPYRRLCFFTLLVMVADVAGGLLIPTIAADMINAGIGGGDMEYLIRSGIRMTAVTIAASLGGILGSYLSADLSSKSDAICAMRFTTNRLNFQPATLSNSERVR